MPDRTDYLKEIIGSLRDVNRLITREKNRSRLIQETCRLIASMGDNVYSWILLMDPDGEIIDSAETGIGKDFRNILQMADMGDLPHCVSEALNRTGVITNRTGEPYCNSCRLKEEGYLDLESCITRLEHRGQVMGVMAAGYPSADSIDDTHCRLLLEIAEDISYALHVIEVEVENARSVRSLSESQSMLNAFLDHFPGPAFIRDVNSRYIHVNRYFSDHFGPEDHWVGQSPDELFDRDFADRMLSEDAMALEKGYHVYEKTLGEGEGRSVYEVHCFRIDRQDDEPLIGGIAVDITDWYHSKKALKESEERYRAVFQNTGSASVIVEDDKTITMVNRGFERLSGFSSDEICGRMKWTEFVHPEDLSRMVNYHEARRYMEREVPTEYEFVFVDRDGCSKDIHLQVDLIPGTKKSVCSLVDISELKETQKQLQKAVRHMETLLRTMPDIMFVIDSEGDYRDYWVDNESVLAIPAERILSSNVGDLGLDQSKTAQIMASIRDTLETGEIQSVEYELDLSMGHRYFEARMAPYDAESVIAVIRDISARREAERKRLELETRIQHTQKLESLGVLAGGIAHDFNNILMTILGNADLARLSLDRGDSADGFLTEIVNAASTASDLAREMLAYSGRSDFEIARLNLNEIVMELTHMMEVSISKKVVLRYRLAQDLPAVMADSTQIRQILMNLITNASEAIGDRSGYISITTGAMYCDRDYLASTELSDDIEEDMYVYLEVSDTGCGMKREVLSQLFEPFFTTKYTGRGLGLSSLLGIVRGHRGAVKVYSEPDHGTTFKVLLPACHEDLNSDPENQDGDSQSGWRGEGTVLFADDEDTVLAVGRRMLETMGFRVMTAGDGLKALELFNEKCDEIDLVILDLTMPHLSGDEVYREMQRSGRDLPVIVSSGFSRKEVMHRFAGRRVDGFIQKPYRTEDLAAVIRQVMEGSG